MTEKEINPSETLDNTVKALTVERDILKTAVAALTQEVENLKRTNMKMAEIEDARLTSELTTDIKRIANYSDEDLEGMKTEQMLNVKEILLRSKGTSAEAFYKPIRAGNASTENANLTVGNLYGKTREDLLKSGGTP
jgi:hypothetical protein